MFKVTRCTSLVTLLALLAPGCSNGPERTATAAPAEQSAAAASRAAPAPRAGKVARIAFVDLERACACTMRNIESSWKALLEVVGVPPKISVDRLHLGKHEQETAALRARRPFMALPGVYFLDAAGGVVELLQGEVSAAQIRKVLE